MYAAIHDLEPECLVGTLGIEVVQPGIGSHLDAALISRPLLRGRDQPRSDVPAPAGRCYIPSLDVPDRLGSVQPSACERKSMSMNPTTGPSGSCATKIIPGKVPGVLPASSGANS